MKEHNNDDIERHLEDLKKYDTDLYEDSARIEQEFLEVPTDNQTLTKKKKSLSFKLVIGLLVISMFLSAAGTLLSIFNIPALDFIQKSRQLANNESIQAYEKAIVTVKSENRKGTGFNISADGLIITNSHIINDQKQSIISFANGQVYQATVLKSYPEKDLAFLSIATEDALPFLEIDPSKQWGIGDHVYIIGNPLAFNFIANEGTIVGETDNNSLDIPALLIDAPIYKGNSGSPVINEEGKVIAIIYAKGKVYIDSEKKQVGYAIPLDQVAELIQNSSP